MNLLELDLDQIKNFVEKLTEAPYRARQIFSWIYQKQATEFDSMSDLPKSLRKKLKDSASLETFPSIHPVPCADRSFKFKFVLKDNLAIESVLMYERNRLTACLSTQVGCAMGCKFCATGYMKFRRNLTSGEIVNQVLALQKYAGQQKITNLVYMGMGEPLINYENVVKSIQILQSPFGFSIAPRRITVSTCGIVPGIEKLSASGLKVILAISLHAPNDKLRDQIMPINRHYNIKSLLKVAEDYYRLNKKRPTFEYVLIGGLNDHPEEARELADVLKNIPCKINLIPFNPIKFVKFNRPDPDRIEKFRKILQDPMRVVTVRNTKGRDINAACGQLCIE